MIKRDFFFILFGLALAGCAGMSIHYYGMEGVRYEEGKMLAHDPKNDRPFSDCSPDAVWKGGKCIIMFADEAKTLFDDYRVCKSDLAHCQRWSNCP